MKNSNYDGEWFKYAQPIQNVSGSNSGEVMGQTHNISNHNDMNKQSSRIGRSGRSRTRVKTMVIYEIPMHEIEDFLGKMKKMGFLPEGEL